MYAVQERMKQDTAGQEMRKDLCHFSQMIFGELQAQSQQQQRKVEAGRVI